MDILIKSIVGGLVIALVLLSVKIFGSKVGGFVAAIPSAFVVAYVFATLDAKNTEEILKFLTGGITASMVFLLFLGVLFLCNKSGVGYWESLAVAYFFWFCALGIFLYLK